MSAVEELKAVMLEADPFVDDGREDLDDLRLAAANERFAEQRPLIRTLDMRASDLGVEQFKVREDLVPLLFAHSVYKSYPESFVSQGRWKNMSVWLNTVCTGDITAVDMDGCVDVDDWLDRLDRAGFHVIVSSGTSGKNSFLVMDDRDLEFNSKVSPDLFGYPYRVPRRNDMPVTLMAPANVRMRYAFALKAYGAVFARPGEVYSLTDEPVRVADTLRQAAMRRAMTDGTASPSDIAAFDADMKERAKATLANVATMADRIVSFRHQPQAIVGPWAMAWRVMEAARAAGVADGEFHPDTVISVAGGLKGTTLPPDYREQMDRFLGPVHRPMLYSMTEQSVIAPMCEAGMYHWPKALMLFILDESGEQLVPIGADGVVTGRLGMYDPMWHGRWGGIVTGDKVTANYNQCSCGRTAPTIEDSVVRYSELSAGGDDKLTCGGTIEEYIRGITSESV
ncbi:MAG: hypothetical protein JWL70_2635 [Acidimicrobiia bacterium]|nr:hypothetical protein [Acidimicrobiia bacterium]